MSKTITESEVETACLEILSELGYSVLSGPDIAPPPEGTAPERAGYSDIVLIGRLRAAVAKLNSRAGGGASPGSSSGSIPSSGSSSGPGSGSGSASDSDSGCEIPQSALEEAVKKVIRSEGANLVADNRHFHNLLVNGVDVEYKRKDGAICGGKVRLFDFENPSNNDFLAVNQFTVIEDNHNRRPDIVLFVNGLPLVVIELKNPAEENATVTSGFKQFETYKFEIPSLFRFNEILVTSDGVEALSGTITSARERFMPWKTIDGAALAPSTIPQIEVMLRGMLSKTTLLDLVRHFVVFEQSGGDNKGASGAAIKKIAGYHQYHAVNKAVSATLSAAGPAGDKRCGVVWHTQGSGKSLTMAFYAGKLVLAMDNPTIVVLTDRNDLDDQLFGTFSRCHELLRQTPIQAESRDKIKTLLNVASGGVVFTTIQKFLPDEKGGRYPLLSDRKNIVVIADEAHRSQYDFVDGFARNMRDALPNASFIGFTGTPIEKADRSTPAVFGDYIDIYDIEQAVKDGATVKIYYESRLAKLGIKESNRPKIDPEFEEATEGEEVSRKEKLKTKWARLEAIVGSEERIKSIARDIVTHFEERSKTNEGKGMIVCMSRRICIMLHDEIVKLRPSWYNKDDDKGRIKVVMTGSASDGVEWQEHIRNKQRRRAIGDRMKDPNDKLAIVIVRDMWLTGFDVPCLHTMYLDKPMRGHGLMQAIARVNRVFREKPGGLVVDYLGIADDLKRALSDYTESGGRGEVAIDKEQAVMLMLEKYEQITAMFHGFDYKRVFTAPPREKLAIIPQAIEHILKQEDGKDRFIGHVSALSSAFALAAPHEAALAISDDVGFFQAIKSSLAKATGASGKTHEELDTAIKQIISKAVASNGVMDIFAILGLPKPDISILSEEFLTDVKKMPYKNLAIEMLRRLLNDELRHFSRKNLVQSRSFAEMLENAIKRYQSKNITTTQILEELVELARSMRDAGKRGEKLGLTEDELAFYDALEVNDSAVKILGDEVLNEIARELVKTVQSNITIDWTLRENVQAKMRLAVKKTLKKYNYPPDKQKRATELILEQAKMTCKNWTEVTG